jgi:uncharacterized repeat protein (TIGR01451 family)
MKRFTMKILTVLVVLTFLLGLLPAAVGAEPPTPSTVANVQTPTDPALRKIISPTLREKALSGGDEPNLVIVFMAAGTDLQGFVQNLMARPPMVAPNGKGITYVTGRTKSGELTKLAGIAGVFAIMSPDDFSAIDPADPNLEKSKPGLADVISIKQSMGGRVPLLSKPQVEAQAQAQAAESSGLPPDWYGVTKMGATAAWANGFNGQGVIISDVDSGADFGHPDLEGAWATVITPTTSPYLGWPMAYDPLGAYIYLAPGLGEAFSPDTVCGGTSGSSSSYSDTSTKVQRSAAGTAVLKQVTYSSTGVCSIINKTYTLPNTSKSDPPTYHVGIHPDSLLGLYQPGDLYYAAVLVVDEHTAGVYDTVYVDWDGDLVFSPWERFTRDHPTGLYYDPVSTSMSRDVTGDGIADISAGLMTWIADGTNYIPGTDVVFGTSIRKPANSGDLVLWYGDYNGESHGTGTTSSAAARGVINSRRGSKATTTSTYGPWLMPDWDTPGQQDTVNHGVVWGTAPEAKVFAGMSTIPTDVWYLSALGYDGVPGTGDEAQISTNSFGYFYLNDGWDPIARFVTFLNAVMGFDQTTWLSGTANGGFGYGTAASPGSAATGIAVGAVNDKGVVKNETSRYTDSQEWIAGPDQTLYGNITPFSSRGPTTMAQTRPNVVAIGDGAPGDVPLNLSALALYLYDQSPVDGNRAWELFGGTSEATPFAAGITALIYQAYKANEVINQGRHEWPTYETAKAILMSSANDAGNDAFVQGAGAVNAEWATRLASGQIGVFVDPPQWMLGDYRGENYISFANIVTPCQSISRTFTISNPTGTDVNVRIEAKYWEEMGHLDIPLNTTLSQESPSRTLRPDYLITLYDKPNQINKFADAGLDYANADMIKVSMSNPYDQSSLTDPSVAPQALNSSWYLKLYEWQDLNGSKTLWNDANGNGVVNDGELDNPPPGTSANPFVGNSSQEMNAYGLSYQVAPTTHEVRIGTVDGLKPWALLEQQRNADGLFIGLRHAARSTAVPTTNITVRVTLYREVAWDPLQVALEGSPAFGSTLGLYVGPNDASKFKAQFTAPCTPGLYEGAIKVSFPWTDPSGIQRSHVTQIPLLFNVALQPVVVDVGNPNNPINFHYNFGNAWASWPSAVPLDSSLYDNKRIFGGQDWLGNGWYDQGDWRLFYADVATDTYNALPPNAKWIVDTKWVAKPTDIDTLVYGPTADVYSDNWPEVYGPYDLALKGGSDNTVYTNPNVGGYSYTFRTNTGGPREIVSADLNPGLNGIFLHNVLYGGLDTSEPFAGRVGYAAVNPNPVWITTTLFSGSLNLTFQSSLDWANGLGALAFGLSHPTAMKDVPIHQNETWTKEFDVSNAASIELSTSSTDPATSDIDLYLDKWTGTAWQSLASSAGATAEEHIKVKFPADGHYRARVEGYAVAGNGKFDFSMNAIQGTDLTVTNLPNGPIAAGQVVTFTLNFNRYAATCYWYGVLYVGPSEAPSAIEIPVTIYFDTPEYVNSTKSVQTMTPDGLVRPGEPITYTLHFQNTGCGDARQAELLDAIPAGTTYVSGSATGGLTYDATNKRVRWSGVLPAGTSKDFTFQITPNADATCHQLILNVAQFKDNWTGLLGEGFVGSTVRCSDLSVTKTGTAKVIPGFPVNYTIAYANAGPDTALDAYVDDMLPAGVTYVSSNPAGVTDPADPSHIRWYLGNLAMGASGTITLVGNVDTTVAEGSTLVNTATIATGITATGPTYITPDPNLVNNSATASTLVPAYHVTIAPKTASIEAGQTQCYTLTATDNVDMWDVTLNSHTTFTIPPAAGGSWTGNCYTAEKAGTWTVTGTYLSKSDTATLTVTHSTDPTKLASVAIAPKTKTVNPRECTPYTLTATDIYGNPWDVTASGTFSITPGAGGTWTGNRYCAEHPGTWTVTGTYLSKSDTATLTVNKWAIYWILIFKNYTGGW